MKKLIVAVFFMAGCCTVPPEHRLADKKFYDHLAKEYREYVEEDESLDATQKAIEFSMLESYKAHAYGEDVAPVTSRGE